MALGGLLPAFDSQKRICDETVSKLHQCQAANGVKAYYNAVERARQLKQVQCIFQRPFALSYWNLRHKQLCLAQGPAHMYVDTWLTLRYAMLKPQLVQWDVPCRAHPRKLAILFKL